MAFTVRAVPVTPKTTQWSQSHISAHHVDSKPSLSNPPGWRRLPLEDVARGSCTLTSTMIVMRVWICAFAKLWTSGCSWTNVVWTYLRFQGETHKFFFFFTGGPRSRCCSLMIIYWLFLETMAVPQPVCAQLEASTWPLCSSLASLVQSTSVETPRTGIRRCISCMGFSESEGVLDSNLWAQLIYQ